MDCVIGWGGIIRRNMDGTGGIVAHKLAARMGYTRVGASPMIVKTLLVSTIRKYPNQFEDPGGAS